VKVRVELPIDRSANEGDDERHEDPLTVRVTEAVPASPGNNPSIVGVPARALASPVRVHHPREFSAPPCVKGIIARTRHPVGEGLVTFRDLDDATAAADAIVRDHAAHADAARELAEKRFASDRVLGRFLDEVGVG